MDYEGTGTDSAASLNYTMSAYGRDVVASLQVTARPSVWLRSSSQTSTSWRCKAGGREEGDPDPGRKPRLPWRP